MNDLCRQHSSLKKYAAQQYLTHTVLLLAHYVDRKGHPKAKKKTEKAQIVLCFLSLAYKNLS